MNTPPAKSKLLKEATYLFAHHGFHGVSVRDISRKAGVNVSLVSRYFDGKKGLYHACIDHLYQHLEHSAPQLFRHIQKANISVLVQQSFDFAQENKQTLLLIQRHVLFEGQRQQSQQILQQFVRAMSPLFPQHPPANLMLNLQSLLFLLTRYALMENQQIIELGSKKAILEHLEQFIRHNFYENHHESS